MCGISAIITPYTYNPRLDTQPQQPSIRQPQEPENTLRALAERLVPDHMRRNGGTARTQRDAEGVAEGEGEEGEEGHVHVEYERLAAGADFGLGSNGVNGINGLNGKQPATTATASASSAANANTSTGQPSDLNPSPTAYKHQLVRELTYSLERLSHRGPDGQGVWVSADGRVGMSSVVVFVSFPSSSFRHLHFRRSVLLSSLFSFNIPLLQVLALCVPLFPSLLIPPLSFALRVFVGSFSVFRFTERRLGSAATSLPIQSV